MSDAFELDVNVANFMYYMKTRMINLGGGGWVGVCGVVGVGLSNLLCNSKKNLTGT